MRKRVALKIVHSGFNCRHDTAVKATKKLRKIMIKAMKEYFKSINIPTSYCRSLGAKRWEAKPNMITGKLTVMEDDNND